MRPIQVPRWEWIDPDLVTDVLEGRGRFLSATDFVAAIRPREESAVRQQIGYRWENGGSQGGLEIFTVDRDDPLFQSRQLCEIRSEENFPQSRRDYREASLWSLTPEEIDRRPTIELPTLDKDTAADPIDLSHFVIPPANNPVVRKLNDRRDALLPGDARSPNWREFYAAANNWTEAYRDFLRSPLSIRRQAAAHCAVIPRAFVLREPHRPENAGSHVRRRRRDHRPVGVRDFHFGSRGKRLEGAPRPD
ncbi:MAG: hypothetical protein QM775_34215 [Pirellulales bacterium]